MKVIIYNSVDLIFLKIVLYLMFPIFAIVFMYFFLLFRIAYHFLYVYMCIVIFIYSKYSFST